ncbi:MAG: protein phosphatase 2C domain-containing protein [Saccharofermentans sp.]|jgi:serine/threonine protein phosphatase PrpC|nr:protein phosphatase 2C domain-containing protein [Mageeibacillus sp.]MCI1263678.1 protein phosphatase 2C domain-containing protein [Saccharofermentans sp.]MCI1274697.1 protein phosphatase 2C domain-containing protein [Saccharofermentans sp.]MCI1769864.1 protein phosphatase 2C domain-containing protein [Mageeibacillus sp.]MCI2043690.1 protein phosphatase 2C domain-containing protein [Mageeibacillus sp.]
MCSVITVGCVTTIGNKHKNRNTPCEDASFAATVNGVSVVCIADGAGGKQYTDARFGSACAVETISSVLCEHFDALYAENCDAAVRGYLMAKLRVEFAKIMQERSLDVIDRLSCTLLFAAVKDRRMMIGHIGDGLIVRISPSGISPISMPQNDKDGKTYFVTAAHADNYLRLIKTTVDDCHAIALMTDGVQDNVYDDSSCLVKPVVVKLADEFTEGRQAGEKAVLETIEKYIVAGSNMSDDASFGVMLFDGTRAPDAAACMTQAGVCGKSSESFAELMKAIRPELVKAHEIIAHKSSDAASDSAAQNVKTEKDSADESKQGTAADNKTVPKHLSRLTVALAILSAVLLIIAIIGWIN